MRCPSCGFEGKFSKAKPRFLVFDLLDSLIERDRAGRSSICPRCETAVTVPGPPGLALTIILLAIVVATGVGVAMLLREHLG